MAKKKKDREMETRFSSTATPLLIPATADERKITYRYLDPAPVGYSLSGVEPITEEEVQHLRELGRQ